MRHWLGPKRKGHEDFEDELPQSDIFDGATNRAAANSIDPCWRERFLASVQDELLGHEPDRVSDEDVVKAIGGVRWAITVGLQDDDD